jgi:hypothetical protein
VASCHLRSGQMDISSTPKRSVLHACVANRKLRILCGALPAWPNESCRSGHLTRTHRVVLFARSVHSQFRCAPPDLTANQFSVEEDWIFAKPVKLGRLPISSHVWRMSQKAAAKAAIQRFGTHSLRHTFRSWVDAAGTGIAVQQNLMPSLRHPDHDECLRGCGDG